MAAKATREKVLIDALRAGVEAATDEASWEAARVAIRRSPLSIRQINDSDLADVCNRVRDRLGIPLLPTPRG